MENNLVKSVDRALTIIELLGQKKEGYGVTELAQKIGLHKSSVFRILSTMMHHQVVEQDPGTGKYKLGYRVLDLAFTLLDSMDLRKEALPYLTELEQETNEVVHLVVIDQGQVVYIEKLEGTQTLRMHSRVGHRAPVHCTAVGKAIMAHLPVREINRIIDEQGLPRHTESTITDREQLMAELDQVKQQGFALDLEENEPGITCIGAPIFDHQGRVVAAVSVSGASMRMTEDNMDKIREKLLDIAGKISSRLGYKR
ncbi:MAG: IclR family transcriptional regulator [Bacillaceae bacterium]|nr:IclR family transcriptional regulator [Bacillaceae bacterium]